MSFPLQVFVSSACYELRDMRASVKVWLEGLGLWPMMSEETGFPHIDGMPPYASCLRVVEECPLIIGVIDRQYGNAFDDWGPYPQHKGRAPTHAELFHALDLGKRVLIYVHNEVWAFHEVWRKSPDAFRNSAPRGLDESTLHLLRELKHRKPGPWMERFNDAADVIKSLQHEFVNQLSSHFREREKQSADQASYLLDKIAEAAPDIRARIEAGLNADLMAEQESLRQRLSELEETKTDTEQKVQALALEKEAMSHRLTAINGQLSQARLSLARAALKDASWLEWVQRTMMPKQPGRVPFHHSGEVATRGYHARVNRTVPILQEVTWSKLDPEEGLLKRQHSGAVILRGSGFLPGATFACRRIGETTPRGTTDYRWHLPHIYFGDYLELATTGDEPDAPLSRRNFEFQIRNPEGEISEWVRFTYPFDDDAIARIREESLREGCQLLEGGRFQEAISPLRRAQTFADQVLGPDHEVTTRAKNLHLSAVEKYRYSLLRFREGDHLLVRSGPHEGNSGIVERIALNHHHAYFVRTVEGTCFQVSDDQVERTS